MWILLVAGQWRAGATISIQADSSSGRTANIPSHSSERCPSLRRLRLADCGCLAESALCSLAGHDALETLDLSCSTHVLTGASLAALQELGGASAEHGSCHFVCIPYRICMATVIYGLHASSML